MDRAQDRTQAIVFLMLNTNETLESIGRMAPDVFGRIVYETVKQVRVKEYQESHRFASLMATIINCTPRKDRRQYKAEDFIGPSPQRNRGAEVSPLEVAKSKGLRIPGGENDNQKEHTQETRIDVNNAG